MLSLQNVGDICHLFESVALCVIVYVMGRVISDIRNSISMALREIGDIKKEMSRLPLPGSSSTSNDSESENPSGEASVKPVQVAGQ